MKRIDNLCNAAKELKSKRIVLDVSDDDFESIQLEINNVFKNDSSEHIITNLAKESELHGILYYMGIKIIFSKI